jgi:plastocyanin
MKVPGFLIGFALVGVGLLAPSAFAEPDKAPASAVGMKHETFSKESVTIPRGSMLTFVNDSGWLHVVGPGDKGRFKIKTGMPALGTRGAFISETADTFTSGPWNTPGVYRVTCSLHPQMNITIKVVVT